MCVLCVYVLCVCERERERERGGGKKFSNIEQP